MYQKPKDYTLEVIVRLGETPDPATAAAYYEELFALRGDADTLQVLAGNNKIGDAVRNLAYRLLRVVGDKETADGG